MRGEDGDGRGYGHEGGAAGLAVALLTRLLRLAPGEAAGGLVTLLGDLGTALALDRVFLMRRLPGNAFAATEEWVAPGVAPVAGAWQGYRPGAFPLWEAALSVGDSVCIQDVAALPPGSAERAALEQAGVRAKLMVPLSDDGRIVGVLGGEHLAGPQDMAREALPLFEAVAPGVAAVLARAGAEAARADLAARLAATLRAIPDQVIELDGAGRFLACHSGPPEAQAVFAAAFLGRLPEEVLPPADAATARALLEEAARRGSAGPVEVQRPGGDGVVRHFEAIVSVLPGEGGGAPAGYLAMVRDRTEARRVAGAAAAREEALRGLFEDSPLPMLLTDYDSMAVVAMNPAFRALVPGLPPGAIAAGGGLVETARGGFPVTEVIPPGMEWVIGAAADQLRDGGRYGPLSCEFSAPDGRRVPVVLRGFIVDDPGGGRLVWSFVQDVTEERRFRAALDAQVRAAEEARARLVAAVEALPDGFVLLDAEDRVALVNRRYRELFSGIDDVIAEGVPYEHMVRVAVERGLHLSARGREGEFIANLLEGHRADRHRAEFHMADGRVIVVNERRMPDGSMVGLRTDVTEQRQAEQRLANVIDGAQVGTWEWNAITGENLVNDRWLAMLGLPAQARVQPIPSSDWLGRIHPDDLPRVREGVARLGRGKATTVDYRIRMRHADGRWVWVQSRGQVVRWQADGRPHMLVGVHLDVTAQSEAEQRLDLLIHGANVGTWEYHSATGICRVNARYAQMLGLRHEALDPMGPARFRCLVHPADYEAMLAEEKALFAAGIWNFDYLLRLRHRDGHWIWVQSRGQVVSWDAQGNPARVTGVHLDVSEAKALELALQRERDTLARLMETSVSGITAVDATGRIVFANREAEKVLGRSLDEIVSRHFSAEDWGITDLDGQPIPLERLPVSRVLAGEGTVRGFAHALRHPDGTRRVISVNAAPLGAPGTELAVVCSVTDITDTIAAQEALQAAIDRAEAASRAKSEFLATISHEIRTPLNGVLGMAQLLAGQVRDPVQQGMLSVIRDSGEHLLALINDVLDLARIERGRLTLDSRPFRAADLAASVEALHGPTAAARGVRLQVDTEPAEAATWRLGDAQRVRQILHNLVGNAVKFTQAGEVRLRLGRAASPPGAMRIEVSDTGIGMDPARIAHVFEDFTQGDGGITRRFGGSGLGLPITRRLARLMGGDIAVETAPGQGFHARVVLPLPALGAGTQGEVAADEGLPALPPLRALVAEDNGTNRLILRAMLDRLGVTSHVVADGDAAVADWAPGEFDILLFDISMPGRDGVAALAAIRDRAAQAGGAVPPALAVTAHALPQDIAGYRAAGFADAVIKPLRIEDLALRIAAVTGTMTGHGTAEV